MTTLAEVTTDGRFIMVHPELVRALDGDAAAAMILEWVRWRTESGSPDTIQHEGLVWVRAPWADITTRTGLSDAVVRRRMETLAEDGGPLLRTQGLSSATDRAYHYTIDLAWQIRDSNRADDADGDAQLARVTSAQVARMYLSSETVETRERDIAASADAAESFEAFWKSYPRRNNMRGSKKLALVEWRKLNPEDRAEAMRMLPHYGRAANGYPVDAERYLKRRLWEGVEERGSGGLSSTQARLAARARELGIKEGGR